MKGLAIRTVVLLVVAVIVIAVALPFLAFVINFDSLFLSNDQRVLAKYSTCALALCAYGYQLDETTPSTEVNAVGCLEFEGGRCVLTCAQAKEKFDEGGIDKERRGDRIVCCDEKSRLDFQFTGISLGGTVPLASGEMERSQILRGCVSLGRRLAFQLMISLAIRRE